MSWRMPRCFAYGRNVIGMGKIIVDKRSACDTRKRGFTLMELMVYIAIVGIVVIVAGQAFSNSTKMRVRTQSMLKASEVAENVAALFKQDVAQTGAKSSMETGTTDAGNNFGAIHASVYMDPTNSSSSEVDHSSFRILSSSSFSDLTIRRLRYDANGFFQATEEVRWYVDTDKLKRSCVLVEKKDGLTIDADDPCGDVGQTPVEAEMADGITGFAVEAAEPGVTVADEQVFPASDAGGVFNFFSRVGDLKYVAVKTVNASGEQGKGGTSITISDFFTNYNSDDDSPGIIDETNQKLNQIFAVKNETLGGTETWKNVCSSYGNITLEAGQEYEISFTIDSPNAYSNEEKNRSLSFVPGVDHLSVGFRDIATGDLPRNNGVKIIEDFLFFPPLDAEKGGGKRTMRFSVPQTIDNLCMAFTFACYSPLSHQGKITIRNLRLGKVAGTNYVFNDGGYNTEAHKIEKKNIKALRLKLKISRNGESGNSEVIVPIPSNGPND